MPPMAFGRRRNDNDHFGDDEAAWDPFWEYVLGEDGGVETKKRSNLFRKQPEPEESDSFLNHLFPSDGKNATKQNSRKSGFWRRKQPESVSSSSSWFGADDDRNEASTARSGFLKKSFRKSKQNDPFVKAKDSFDSFMNHYYGSDVETSDEEVWMLEPRQSGSQQGSLIPKLGSARKRNEESTTSFPSFLNWEAENEKKSRGLFGRKEKQETSVLGSITAISPMTLLSQSSSDTQNRKSSFFKNKSKASQSSSYNEQNLSPLERIVETFDAFGNVATSSEEYSSSNSSNDEDYDEGEETEESSLASSYGNASRSTRSYVTADVTADESSIAAAASDSSLSKYKSNALKRQRALQKKNQSRRSVDTIASTVSPTQRDLNEVLLKYTPERSYSQRFLSKPNNMLPPLDNGTATDGDDDDDGTETEGASTTGTSTAEASTALAGESVLTRSYASTDEDGDDEGGDDDTYDEDDNEERADNSTIAQNEETPPPDTNNLSVQTPAPCHVPAVLPKSVANSDKTPVDDDSFIGRARSVLSRNNRSSVGKMVCCSIKDLTPDQQDRCRQSGIPVHELTPAELEEIFPKVRSISEAVPFTRARSHVIGNSKLFEKDFPAHLQAIVNQDGPQSLYEYEYEMRTHKVLVYEKFGNDPRSLLCVHVSEKPPLLFREGFLDDDKVIIQVEASTVSQTDCMIREGRWAGVGGIPLPNSPGVEVVGRVYSIGKKAVPKFGIDVGERVMALTQYGGNARYLAVSGGQFVKVPESIDPAEAACLAETYLTAFQALHYGQSYGVRYRKTALKGKQIMIIGSVTTNMGRALSQLSTAAAADNLYATSKQKHYQRLTSLGILPLSMDPLHWFERLKGKIDLIISFGEEITPLHFKVLKSSGEALLITNDGSDPTKDIGPILKSPGKFACARRSEWQNKSRLNSYSVFNEWDNNLQKSKSDLEHLLRLLDERRVSPEVLDRIPLHKVPRAQELINTKNIPGFIVCEPWIISKSRAVLL